MKSVGLSHNQIERINSVFRRHPNIVRVEVYGSRAKGTFRPESDIDLVVLGIQDDLEAEAIAEELDELPLPYRFNVKAYDTIRYQPLRDHIARAGVTLYQRTPPVGLLRSAKR